MSFPAAAYSHFTRLSTSKTMPQMIPKHVVFTENATPQGIFHGLHAFATEVFPEAVVYFPKIIVPSGQSKQFQKPRKMNYILNDGLADSHPIDCD